MNEYIKWVAAKIATLQNNLDIVEDEYDLEQNRAAAMMAAQYESQVELLTQATMRLGYTVQVDGPRRHRTCSLRCSASYTSHSLRRAC